MSFSDLKKQSSIGSLTQKLVKEVEKMNNTGGGADERLWKPEMDKTGNGYAVIRFLPAPDGEELPWAKMYSHAFQGPGGWYIENSLTTNGGKDPVSEYNRELWNSGIDADKETVRKQKRKLSYYANIYVVQDKANPQNEGRVFLYKFGKKIFDKLVEAMQPAFADETPIDPFNFWNGADFKLKIRKVDGYWNYDKSEFASAGTLGNFDDDKLESIWKQGYSLAEFEDPKNFKSYEQLQARLNLVLGKGSAPARPVDESLEDESEGRGSFNDSDITPSNQPDWAAEVKDFRENAVAAAPVEETVDLSYFAKLADED